MEGSLLNTTVLTVMLGVISSQRTSTVENVERHLKEKTMSNNMKEIALVNNNQVVALSYDNLEPQHRQISKL